MSDLAKEIADLLGPEPYTGPTTDEMDSTTAEERGKLVGFCEFCNEWYKFTRGMDMTPEEERCPKCGATYSHRQGFQITSQRSFNPANKKKLPKKK